MTDLAATVVDRLRRAFAAAADAERAVAMAAYMRDQFAFFGIPTPRQRAVARQALAGLPPPTEADVVEVTGALWALREREFQYAACDYAIRHVSRCGSGVLPTVATLITTKSWWDTVDALAARVVGPVVLADRRLAATMRDWVENEDIWLVRTSLLHQLHFRTRTDAALLFASCERRATDDEFFIRKAIGWALREYSKTDSSAVRTFVASHIDDLSRLSRREALKWVDR